MTAASAFALGVLAGATLAIVILVIGALFVAADAVDDLTNKDGWY